MKQQKHYHCLLLSQTLLTHHELNLLVVKAKSVMDARVAKRKRAKKETSLQKQLSKEKPKKKKKKQTNKCNQKTKTTTEQIYLVC